MKKKLFSMVGGLLALSAIGFAGGAISLNASADAQPKVIDFYVIAGQSNAAGCATVSSLSNNRKKAEYTSGFEDIYFYGKVDVNESLNANGPFNTFDKVVKLGQGFDDDRFGAEIGIADRIAASGTENESIIVKYASGSLDITNHWCPPSERGGTTKGAWYDGCINTVQTAVSHYLDLGYTVNLKGTFWMQGEAESEKNGNANLYEEYLTSLIGDMREDYAEMFGASAESAPFVVGKVAPTYNLGEATQTSVVRAAQDKVAQTLDNVYTAETDRYIIVDPETGNRAPGCVDDWHFNGNDMWSLGMNVGRILTGDTQEKSIAMYLIAGQSNASGYSLVSQVSEAYRTEHKDGFEGVYYFGRADHVYYNDFNTIVKFGLGRSNSQFGSEVGIAEKHKANFPDQEAVIVKYAMGSTYLVDEANNVTNEHGNWTSPSMPRTQAGKSGKLYDNFIKYIDDAVDYYYALGYEIDLKGTFWMQGEAEVAGAYNKLGGYDAHLKAFISDLRNDCAEILQDDAAKFSPFVIGEICKTFDRGGAGVNAVRKMQEEVAAELINDRVYIVETAQYPMEDPVTGTNRGPDYYHYEGNDMLNIGRDVGEVFVTVGKAHVRVKVQGWGTVDVPEYVFLSADETKTITFTPTRDRYILKSLVYDGVDVTAQVVNNAFTITDTEGKHMLIATFDKEPKYAITVEANDEMVTVSRDPFEGKHYAGAKVKISVKANEGYQITSVKYNGEAVALANGAFEITVIAGENKVVVEASSDGTQIPSKRPQKPTSTNNDPVGGASSGCSSVVAVAPVAVVALGLGLACLLKKKED